MDRAEQKSRMELMESRVIEGGGEQRREQQHAKGKLCARERIEQLTDSGSFIESQKFMTCRSHSFGMTDKWTPGDGVVTGTALIDSRQVWISSQDFTVLGGTLGEQHAERIARAQEMALKTRVPFIQINDSGGARIQEGIYSLDGYGKIFRNNIYASGVIPQLSLILGPCAGGAAYSPALTDFVFMVDGISQMYITGPDVIKTVTGETVSHEQLGGPKTHSEKSGNIHFHCGSEKECFALVKKLLSYLPANNREYPPLAETDGTGGRKSKNIEKTLPDSPTRPYDMHQIIEDIFDADSFLEVQKEYAQNVIVGFARLSGRSVGVLANQPKVLSGTLDIDSSDKAARFVRFCDAFNISIVSLVDVPGYMPGTVQEYGGIIRHGAKLLYAIGEATVPKLALVVRKAYGGAYIAMAARTLGYDKVLALPGAEIAVMGAEGAVDIIFRREIQSAVDSATLRSERVKEFRKDSMNPYVSATAGMVDDVIAPEDVRIELIRSLESLAGKSEQRPHKKHGNLPL